MALEIWAGFIVAGIALGVAAYRLARRDDSVEWDTNRRAEERREGDRRTGVERRSLSRLIHDRIHNPGRRRAERREADRRRGGDWTAEADTIRQKVEASKQDGPH
jgi:hypothetical protein